MTPPPTPPPTGPMRNGAGGVSAERTRLSWRRTALASTAIVLLTARLAFRDRFTALGGTVIAIALVVWLAQMWLTQRRIDEMARSEPSSIGRTLPAMALTVVLFAILALLLALTGQT